MLWVLIKYTRTCVNHSFNKTYIVPITDVQVEGTNFDRKKEYLAKCIKDKDKWCHAFIGCIREGSKNRIRNKRISFPPVSEIRETSDTDDETEAAMQLSEEKEKQNNRLLKLRKAFKQPEPKRRYKKKGEDTNFENEENLQLDAN